MDRVKYCSRVLCLVLMAVLFLGLVQWSFLPLLVDGQSDSPVAVLTIGGGHTAKFAAPFKFPFGDSSSTCLPEVRQTVPVIIASIAPRIEESSPLRENIFYSDRLFRAPPSA